MQFDALIIGGSFAGISAALQLARARQNILVIDGGSRRNRFADHSHGFLGQDGRPPQHIIADAKAQLLKYPTVTWQDGIAEKARRDGAQFIVTLEDGTDFSGRYVLLATGVRDTLPDIPGLWQRWGKSVFHCPYCHGYELNQNPVGVLAVSEASMHQALMLPDWGPTTFFLNDAFAPDERQHQQLLARGITIEPCPVDEIKGDQATIMLSDGREIDLAGLFVAPRTEIASPIAQQLGCAMEEGPTGAFIRTDQIMETSIPGVFACGDAAMAMGSVALSVANGARAGAAVHYSLIFKDESQQVA